MMNEQQIKQSLRDWVVKTNGKIRAEELDDNTPIVERRIITSVQVMDLIIFLEEFRGRPVDVSNLKVGAFQTVDAIYHNFFEAPNV